MRSHAGSTAILAALVALNVVAWGVFAFVVLPGDHAYRGLGVGLGVGVTAWTLGVRHAFDADHIAAIDIATRKLLADGRPATGTGFFFALGHASVVVLVAVGILLTGRFVLDTVSSSDTWFASTAGLAAAGFASAFLLAMATVNLGTLAGIVRDVRAVRRGVLAPSAMQRHLRAQGLVMRAFGPLLGSVRRSRHMFLVGFVFGISFETATEVLLLAGTTAAVGEGLPWPAVISLPLLFAGGMALFDSLNGAFMMAAYRWAFTRPARRLFYNFTITALSVLVAVLVGGVQLIRLVSERLHLRGWLADAATGVDLATLGYVVVAMFALTWFVALAVWRFGRIESRWDAAVRGTG